MHQVRLSAIGRHAALLAICSLACALGLHSSGAQVLTSFPQWQGKAHTHTRPLPKNKSNAQVQSLHRVMELRGRYAGYAEAFVLATSAWLNHGLDQVRWSMRAALLTYCHARYTQGIACVACWFDWACLHSFMY